MVSLKNGIGKAFWCDVMSRKMVRGQVTRRGGSGRVMGNVGGFILVGSRHFLEDVAVIENFSGVLIRKLEEVVKEAGISRINERGFPVII